MSPCLQTAVKDFVDTLNESSGCLTEFAFASPGTSNFNRAIYCERPSESSLLEHSQSGSNVSFATGFCKERLDSIALGTQIIRQGADRYVRLKNILSFDVDFKGNTPNYEPSQREDLITSIWGKIREALSAARISTWMTVFSGNGLHLHFKLRQPYEISSAQRYRQIYSAIRCYLECISDIKFDPACSNPSRLVRLPFSTNWKDRHAPVACVILEHNPTADFTSLFNGFRAIAAHKLEAESLDKATVLKKINLIGVLEFFEYPKIASLKTSGDQTVCSSPFSRDSDPSFFYDHSRKVFYDFSTSKGGDIFNLIGELAHLDAKNEFPKILKIAAKIAGEEPEEQSASGYHINEKGVWYQQAKDADPKWLSSPVFVEALTRNASGRSWGRLLTFKDQDGVIKNWSMPMELLAGDGSEIRRNLLSLGAEMAIGKCERQLFLAYLQGARPSKRTLCVDRIGWHQDQFVLPNKIYLGAGTNVDIILQGTAIDTSFGRSGSLADWQKHVGMNCKGNSRLVFAVSSALASTLLKSTGEESGGFHFVGPSSIGKSITLKIAASVWGNTSLNGFVKRWRSTLNGLEILAALRCDSLLILDELGEILPKDAGYASYMLSGGTSKNRATKTASLSTPLEWRLLFLSSGEIPLAAHIAQSGGPVNVGQEVRMIDIPAETANSQGIFENIHGLQSSGALASLLAENSEKYFGTAIDHFLTQLVSTPSALDFVAMKRAQFIKEVNQNSSHGQIGRALKRFSLVAAAGELGTEFGTLPWAAGESITATRKCFQDWLYGWGGNGSREEQQLIEQIKSLLQEFGASRFPLLSELKKHQGIHNQQLWGFRKETEGNRYQWFILSEIFRTQFCKGHDHRRALRHLKEQKLLLLGPSGQTSSPMRVPYLGVTRFIHLDSRIIE